MAIQIDGSSQTAQQQNTLNKLTREAGQFARKARSVTSQINEFIRKHEASGFGDDLGQASASEYVSASPDSVTVGKYRTMLKAACSYAVVVGELSQSKADTMLQTAYGNDTETTVSASEISSLTDQWV